MNYEYRCKLRCPLGLECSNTYPVVTLSACTCIRLTFRFCSAPPEKSFPVLKIDIFHSFSVSDRRNPKAKLRTRNWAVFSTTLQKEIKEKVSPPKMKREKDDLKRCFNRAVRGEHMFGGAGFWSLWAASASWAAQQVLFILTQPAHVFFSNPRENSFSSSDYLCMFGQS